MSTLGSLAGMLGQMPQIRPWDIATRSQNEADTGLIELQQLKAKQAAEQEMLLAIKQNPALAQQLFGGSVLGSIGPAGGMPAPGGAPPPAPITQSPLGGGPAQQIPAYADASRYAGVSPQGGGPIPPDVMAQTMPTVTPPQSTIASLGPAGQPQMQAPRNPVLEMAATNPRAAMMLQQQMQGAQEQRWKTEERRLDMGVKISEAVAQELNGVRDQASLDAARERIRLYHPQAAAQIPQFYSKEALEPLIMKGVAVKDLALWRKNMASAKNTEMMTEQLPGTFRALEQFATGGGGQAPTGEAPTTTTAPTTATQARSAPPEYESAITEANRLFPQVSTTRIKSIIAAESNFDSKAKSGAGAEGLMQLMPATQKDMGVDNPYDPQQNVRGGTRYYAQLLTRYGGDERKALAAYNWGAGNLDKVNGDVSKAPAETQAYVAKVLGGGSTPAGGTGTAQAPPASPKIAQLDTRIKEGQALALRLSATPGMEQAATMVNQQVNDLQKERDRLVDRSTEIPRAVEKETALQPLKIAQQEAGARIQNESKMNEPIGTENAVKMNLPPNTKWKDVPKDVRVLERPPEGVSKQFGDFKASYEGLSRVIGMMDNPKARSIVGTLLSEPDASFRRLAGEWVSSVTPAERKFAAALVGEIATIRNSISGTAVSEQESAFLRPMLPSVTDPDVGTVRAKLEALQEWVARKHEGYRDQQDQLGFRTPKALAKPVSSLNLEEAKAERERIRKGGG